jgi:hypothetical protein
MSLLYGNIVLAHDNLACFCERLHVEEHRSTYSLDHTILSAT